MGTCCRVLNWPAVSQLLSRITCLTQPWIVCSMFYLGIVSELILTKVLLKWNFTPFWHTILAKCLQNETNKISAKFLRNFILSGNEEIPFQRLPSQHAQYRNPVIFYKRGARGMLQKLWDICTTVVSIFSATVRSVPVSFRRLFLSKKLQSEGEDT